MRKLLYLSLIILAGSILFSSCKKDETKLELQEGKFIAPGLITTAEAVILNPASENDTAFKLIWQAAAFGEAPVVTYTLQMTTPADITGGNDWGNAIDINIDRNMLRYGFTGKYLNNLLGGLGLAAGQAHDMVFRVKAAVTQNNGTASTIPVVYSNVVRVNITTYETDLYVPGEYQGWDPASAPVISPAAGLPGMYEGYVDITGTGVQYFKFTNAPDWNHTNYGDGGGGTFSTDGAAAGLSVPEPGYYELTADLNTNKWTATKTTWGIIGDASPGGWGADTQMTYDPVTQVWTATLDMIHNGSFKFRANGAWSIDFGIDADGKLKYADNPFFGYNGTLSNLTVPEDGNYTITLDLHVSGDYTYILHKN